MLRPSRTLFCLAILFGVLGYSFGQENYTVSTALPGGGPIEDWVIFGRLGHYRLDKSPATTGDARYLIFQGKWYTRDKKLKFDSIRKLVKDSKPTGDEGFLYEVQNEGRFILIIYSDLTPSSTEKGLNQTKLFQSLDGVNYTRVECENNVVIGN